ncbi:DUF6011 domain-containing protein [Streptomyces sp. NPDC056454]|uniref:DUF6011 domain-containing protein n=1 Tax=Streptomyces sp. NPDC056454 TaxID=3345823 RepID=UPI0036C7EC45
MSDTCGVCNRPLLDPESRAAGIGPTCAKKFHGSTATAGSHQLTFEEPMTDQPKTPAVWTDGDPLMEATASAVWEQCNTEGPSSVVDDPRTIAAVAATVARQVLGTKAGPKPSGRCGNDPRTVLSPGDQAAVAEFKEYLAEKRRADDAEKERDGLRRALHLLRYGMARVKGNDFAAEYVVSLIDETVAQCTGTVMEPCDADEQRARAVQAEAAIKRTVDQMRAYVVASGSAGVNPNQVIELLSLTWPNGNHEAPAPEATEATS